MIVVAVVAIALLVVAAGMLVVRLERGPSMLDRTVAFDVLLTTLIVGAAVYAATVRRTDVVPILVALSLVGFVGSVTIARFAAVEPEDVGRVRTREEVAAEEAELRRLEDEAFEAERREAAAEQRERSAERDRSDLVAQGDGSDPAEGLGRSAEEQDRLAEEEAP